MTPTPTLDEQLYDLIVPLVYHMPWRDLMALPEEPWGTRVARVAHLRAQGARPEHPCYASPTACVGGRSALTELAEAAQHRAVRRLLPWVDRIDAPGMGGFTALVASLRTEMMPHPYREHTALVLWRAGANPYAEHPHSKASAVALAAALGYRRLLWGMAQAGVDFNRRDSEGWTPLGRLSVQRLNRPGPSSRMVDLRYTVMQHAALLVALGADPSRPHRQGDAPEASWATLMRTDAQWAQAWAEASSWVEAQRLRRTLRGVVPSAERAHRPRL